MSTIHKIARLGLFLAALASAPYANATGQVTVEIKNFAFEPKVLAISPGTEVTWINRDDEPHTIVNAADPKALTSPVLDTNEKFSFVFRDAGSFNYFCSVHPHMQGVVLIK